MGIGNDQLCILMYADDRNGVDKYGRQLRVTFIVDGSGVLVLIGVEKDRQVWYIYINIIKCSKGYKYLGVTLYEKVCREATSKGNSITSL